MVDEWGRIFYDPVLASAILDGLVHHCHFVLIKGKSFRMKQQEKFLANINKKD
jgi:DNA replication protein DnaC